MNFLIIPSRPTPNGSLHLGHIAGPYLRADILKRALNRQGHHASMILSIDAYDSYVEFDAFATGKKCKEYCTENSKEILADLDFLNISYDKYVNPLDPAINKNLQKISTNIYLNLMQNKCLIKKKVPRFYDVNSDRYLYGAWLQGQCPSCAAPANGSFCETCFSYIDAENLSHPQPYFSLKSTTHKNISLPYFQQKLYAEDWQKLTANVHKFYQKDLENLSQVAKAAYCERSKWGIKINKGLILTPALSLLTYCLMLGDVYAGMFGTENSFNKNSNTKTIAFAGVDSLMRYQYLLPALTKAYKKAKPFDYCIFNQFLLLDGQKFSKSRKHAIWVKELTTGNLSSDYARYFLSHLDLQQKETNFDSKEFYNDAEKSFTQLIETIDHAILTTSGAEYPKNDQLQKLIINLIHKQNQYLIPEQFFPEKAIHLADKFFALFPALHTMSERKTWLFGLSKLYQPFLPSLAMKIENAKKYKPQGVFYG